MQKKENAKRKYEKKKIKFCNYQKKKNACIQTTCVFRVREFVGLVEQ